MSPIASSPSAPVASLFEVLAYQINGLIVVFTALIAIWMAVEIVGFAFKRAGVARRVEPRGTVAADASVDGVPSAETVAVIAAAVHVALGETRHAIRAIDSVGTDPDWAREGRRQIFSSHQVR